MTIGIFSDVHANLPAFEAVLEDMDRRELDAVFCLGDLVGYAPWPNEVVSLIRKRRIPTIAGNYDEGVGLDSDDCGCAYKTEDDRARGAESIAFTNGAVTPEVRSYLNGLPRHMALDFQAPRLSKEPTFRLLMVHGSPRRINEYLFEDRPDSSFIRMLDEAHADVMLFGHTHKPFHKTFTQEDGEGRTFSRHVVNTGSVGKPKDGDPRACYVVLHLDGGQAADGLEAEFVRVEYDVEQAARAVEQSPLPDAFADMLRRAY